MRVVEATGGANAEDVLNNEGRMHIVINAMDLAGATPTQRAAAPVDLVLLLILPLWIWICGARSRASS